MQSKGKEIEEALRQAAVAARQEQTPAEKALWAMVRAHRCGGLHFRRQTRLGPFRVDFYCAALSLSIEIDGGIHNEPDVQRRDAERQTILEQEYHLRFLRISNEDVLQRPKQTRQRILDYPNPPQNSHATTAMTYIYRPLSLSEGGGVPDEGGEGATMPDEGGEGATMPDEGGEGAS